MNGARVLLCVVFAVAMSLVVIPVILVILRRKTTEAFTSSSSSVRFVTFSEFRDAFLASGHLRVDTSNSKDLAARHAPLLHGDVAGGFSKARSRYISGFLEPTPRLRAHLQEAARAADSLCVSKGCSALRDDVPWNIALTADHVENGFPHTIGRVICLPLRAATEASNKNSHLVTTLLHEKIHVFQRETAAAASSFLEAAVRRLGYVYRVHRNDLPDHVRARLRSNPDLDGYYYGKKPGVVVAALYPASRDPVSLADVRVEEIHLSSSSGGNADIKTDSRKEHPWEEMAYGVSHWLTSSFSFSNTVTWNTYAQNMFDSHKGLKKNWRTTEFR